MKKDLILDFSTKLGLSFQIIDDILDETASFENLGKTPGKDKESGKLTYVKIFGLIGAKKEAHTLLDELEKILRSDSTKNNADLIKTVLTDLRRKIE